MRTITTHLHASKCLCEAKNPKRGGLLNYPRDLWTLEKSVCTHFITLLLIYLSACLPFFSFFVSASSSSALRYYYCFCITLDWFSLTSLTCPTLCSSPWTSERNLFPNNSSSGHFFSPLCCAGLSDSNLCVCCLFFREGDWSFHTLTLISSSSSCSPASLLPLLLFFSSSAHLRETPEKTRMCV